MATSMGGSRGMMQNRTGASSGNRSSGSMQLGTNQVPQGYQMGQLQQFTPEQMDLFKNLFGQVGGQSQLGKLASGDQSTFDQLEAPAFRQLGQLQSGLASKFSGLGMGARRSSGFQQAQGSLASDFAEKLQAQRMGLQRQAQQDLWSMSNDLLGHRPNEWWNQKEEEPEMPFWQKILGGSFPLIGAAGGAGLGFLAGGPAGALAGGQLGGKLGSSASQAFFK